MRSEPKRPLGLNWMTSLPFMAGLFDQVDSLNSVLTVANVM
jgi:hypothetical protein